MCSAGAAAAIAGGASVLQGVEDRKEAKREQQFQNDLAARNNDLAFRDARASELATLRRVVETRAATENQVREVTRRGERVRGEVIVSAAETGTSGASVAALNEDFLRAELESVGALKRGQEFQENQAQDQLNGINRSLERNLLAAVPPSIRIPGFLGILLGGAQSAAGGAQIGQSFNSTLGGAPKTTPPPGLG